MDQSWRALYPFESKYFDRGNGIKLHYIDEGAGDPVVMVHGNPTWSFHYRNLAKSLMARHRAIALDHVGMGLSDRPSEAEYRYTLDSRVEDFGKLVDHLGLETLSLVVHDWGGMIALSWAVDHPERVSRLVVLNTAGFPMPAGKLLPWQLALARGRLGEFLMRDLNAFVLGTAWTCAERGLSKEEKEGYLFPYRTKERRLAVTRFVQDIPLGVKDLAWQTVNKTGMRLSALSGIPVLVGWGARDFVFDDMFFAEWNRRLPRAEFQYFPNAGHLVLEDERDRLVPQIAEFLRKKPVRAG